MLALNVPKNGRNFAFWPKIGWGGGWIPKPLHINASEYFSKSTQAVNFSKTICTIKFKKQFLVPALFEIFC